MLLISTDIQHLLGRNYSASGRQAGSLSLSPALQPHRSVAIKYALASSVAVSKHLSCTVLKCRDLMRIFTYFLVVLQLRQLSAQGMTHYSSGCKSNYSEALLKLKDSILHCYPGRGTPGRNSHMFLPPLMLLLLSDGIPLKSTCSGMDVAVLCW